MINYFEEEDFNRTVFTVEEGKVIEHKLADLCLEYAVTTTTPHGIARCFHTKGSELWAWSAINSARSLPVLIQQFDSEAEAEHALLLSCRYDLFNRQQAPYIHDTREAAELDLAELTKIKTEERI